MNQQKKLILWLRERDGDETKSGKITPLVSQTCISCVLRKDFISCVNCYRDSSFSSTCSINFTKTELISNEDKHSQSCLFIKLAIVESQTVSTGVLSVLKNPESS